MKILYGINSPNNIIQVTDKIKDINSPNNAVNNIGKISIHAALIIKIEQRVKCLFFIKNLSLLHAFYSFSLPSLLIVSNYTGSILKRPILLPEQKDANINKNILAIQYPAY